jgi:predicted amidophosphoribosyltransferase
MILPIKGAFACCPYCGGKLTRIAPDTEAERLPVWCRKCRRELLIDIQRGQSFLSRSPDQTV